MGYTEEQVVAMRKEFNERVRDCNKWIQQIHAERAREAAEEKEK